MTVRAGEMRVGGAFLRELAAAMQSLTLYPPGHPHRVELVTRLAAARRSLVESAFPREPTIFIDQGSFYSGSTLLVRESLTLGRLALAFMRAGIESVTLLAGDDQDIEQLVEVLRGDRERPPALQSIRFNAVRPTYGAQHAWQERLTELRRAYAAGIDVLKESSIQAAAGTPLDIEAATGVVEQLADQVSRDPGFGLLLSAVKSYDEYTYFHMVNVCLMSVALGQMIGLRHDQVLVLGLGGLLHDIGKVHVPQDILNAPGKLDEEQWRIIQRHPVEGAGLLFSTRPGFYHPAVSIVLEHHAGFETGGYPALHGHRPSVPSRLVAVADCFDAITSKRPYRDALDRHEALRIIEAAAGSGLDPDAVRVFERLLGDYPIGALVKLDTGEVGIVVRQHARLRDRPTVLVLLDKSGAPAEVEERDLAETGAGMIVERLEVRDVGIDLSRFVVSGEVAQAPPQPEHGGLVHEPAPSEPTPEGYVDTHAHGHAHALPDGRPDPEVMPPIE